MAATTAAIAIAVLIAAVGPTAAAAPDLDLPRAFNVEWALPSPGPGHTQDKTSTYMDAMPLGNGRTTALAWADVATGGVGIYLGSQVRAHAVSAARSRHSATRKS